MRFKKNTALLLLIALLLLSAQAIAQQKILVNMAMIDGIDITPDNILNIRLQSFESKSSTVQVRGTLRYRQSQQNLSYSFRYTLNPGMNVLNASLAHPQWQFSSGALQELFQQQHILPASTYEYCVTVDPVIGNEVQPGGGEECVYHQSDDFFLINLISPEDKAKLHEYYPMLSWVANYSFASQLTYRLRIAEIKQGQNPTNAALRNQPVYDESNLYQNSKVYPTYARPLVHDQPYAWTVDAYYKGILLGSAEAWQFIIKEDTIVTLPPGDRSYLDIRRESGQTQHYAVGTIKLKYFLDFSRKDLLKLTLQDASGTVVSFSAASLQATYGDNRYEIDLRKTANLKHNNNYELLIENKRGEVYRVPFTYVNPDFAQ